MPDNYQEKNTFTGWAKLPLLTVANEWCRLDHGTPFIIMIIWDGTPWDGTPFMIKHDMSNHGGLAVDYGYLVFQLWCLLDQKLKAPCRMAWQGPRAGCLAIGPVMQNFLLFTPLTACSHISQAAYIRCCHQNIPMSLSFCIDAYTYTCLGSLHIPKNPVCMGPGETWVTCSACAPSCTYFMWMVEANKPQKNERRELLVLCTRSIHTQRGKIYGVSSMMCSCTPLTSRRVSYFPRVDRLLFMTVNK